MQGDEEYRNGENPLDARLEGLGIFSREQLEVLQHEAIESVGDLLGATAGLQNATLLDGWLPGLGDAASRLGEVLPPDLLTEAAQPLAWPPMGAIPEADGREIEPSAQDDTTLEGNCDGDA